MSVEVISPNISNNRQYQTLEPKQSIEGRVSELATEALVAGAKASLVPCRPIDLIGQKQGVIWNCTGLTADNGGYIYHYKLDDSCDPSKSPDAEETAIRKISAVFPAVEPPAYFKRIGFDELQTLGYSFKSDGTGIYLNLPDITSLEARYEQLRKTRPELPPFKIISSDGIADNLSFIRAYLKYDALLSSEKEFVHDHMAHISLVLQMMLSSSKKYIVEKKRIAQLVEELFKKLTDAEEYIKREKKDELLPELLEIQTTLGAAVDIAWAVPNIQEMKAFTMSSLKRVCLDTWDDRDYQRFWLRQYGKNVDRIYARNLWEKFTKLAEMYKIEKALCLYEGKGVVQNIPEATRLLYLEADQNNTEAQYFLANCYCTGEGVEKNLQEAIYLYTQANDEGHPSAATGLLICEKMRENFSYSAGHSMTGLSPRKISKILADAAASGDSRILKNKLYLYEFRIRCSPDLLLEALYKAISNGHLEIIQLLLNVYEPRKLSKVIGKILLWAAGGGQTEIVKLIKTNWEDKIEEKDLADCYLYSSLMGHSEITEYLHAEGVQIDSSPKAMKKFQGAFYELLGDNLKYQDLNSVKLNLNLKEKIRAPKPREVENLLLRALESNRPEFLGLLMKDEQFATYPVEQIAGFTTETQDTFSYSIETIENFLKMIAHVPEFKKLVSRILWAALVNLDLELVKKLTTFIPGLIPSDLAKVFIQGVRSEESEDKRICRVIEAVQKCPQVSDWLAY